MKISVDDDIFADLIEKLLTGQVICRITEARLYNYLTDPDYDHEREVDGHLWRMGRTLRPTPDKAGYYAAYRDLSSKSVKHKIRQQFNEAVNEYEPLIRWLRMTASAEKSGVPLQLGDALRESELLQAIENAPALVNELEILSRSRLFKNENKEPKKQLGAILSKLCGYGYLVSKGSSGTVFIATGKWSRLYEVLEFVATHEQLDGDEDEQEQKELL